MILLGVAALAAKMASTGAAAKNISDSYNTDKKNEDERDKNRR